MRYIDMSLTHEINIETTDADGKPTIARQTIGMDWVMAHFLTNDSSFNSDGAGIRASTRLENALLAWGKKEVSARPRWLPLDEADWRVLDASLETPRPLPGRAAYPIVPARRINHMIDAIHSAPDKEPEEEPACEAHPALNGASTQPVASA